jgi:hypothetical protein
MEELISEKPKQHWDVADSTITKWKWPFVNGYEWNIQTTNRDEI